MEQGTNNKTLSIIKTVLWPVTGVLYVILGVVFHAWHPGWVIFLVAAVVQTVIKAIEKSNKPQ
jgi:asparagine N-glycosylation enzyme membrane subunit Stt3